MGRRQRGYFDSDYDYGNNPPTSMGLLIVPAIVVAIGGAYLLTRKKPVVANDKNVVPVIPPPAKGTYRAEGTWAELQDWRARWFATGAA